MARIQLAFVMRPKLFVAAKASLQVSARQ